MTPARAVWMLMLAVLLATLAACGGDSGDELDADVEPADELAPVSEGGADSIDVVTPETDVSLDEAGESGTIFGADEASVTPDAGASAGEGDLFGDGDA